MKYAYFNNKIVEEDKAVVSIKTHSFNYGTAVFEGIKAYYQGPGLSWFVFRPFDHYTRLLKSARMLNLDLPITKEEFVDILAELLRRNKLKSTIYFRPILYANRLGVGLSKATNSSFAVYTETMPVVPVKSLKCCIVDTIKTPSSAIPASGKICGAYINSYLAQTEASGKGYDVAFLKTINGYISEAFGMNIFVIKNGKLHTSPCEDDILEGVTRNCIIKLAKIRLQIDTLEEHITPEFLLSADEVFICGTGSEINAVVSIDSQIISNGNVGNFTNTIRELYLKVVNGNLPELKEWFFKVSID